MSRKIENFEMLNLEKKDILAQIELNRKSYENPNS